jgi:hypothetical protein
MHFDDATKFHWDGQGDYVFDWARPVNELPVRVQAYRKFVTDVWKEDWKDQKAVQARFDSEKHKHVPSLAKAAGGSMSSFRVYVMG